MNAGREVFFLVCVLTAVVVAQRGNQLVNVGPVLPAACSGREVCITKEGTERGEEYGEGKHFATRK